MKSRQMLKIVILAAAISLTACNSGSKPESTTTHANGGVFYATLSDDSRFALVTSVNQPTTLWDLRENKRLHFWFNTKKNNGIIANDFSPDGRYAITAEKNNIALWDIRSGKTLNYWTLPTNILAAALGNDAHYALLGFQDGNAEYIDLHDGRSIRRFTHNDKVNSVAISKDERYALTGSDDRTAKLWNVQTGKLIHEWPHKNSVVQVEISPKGNYALTAASQGDIKIWDIKSGKVLYTLNGEPTTISAARFSPSEKYIATGTLPQELKLWNMSDGKKLKSWRLPRPSYWRPSSTIVRAISFSPDEDKVYTEDSNGNNYGWKIK